jgi:hypothetical protein
VNAKPISIVEALPLLLGVVAQLQKAYPKKRFTLDGRLLGDIGEVLVEQHYEVILLDTLSRHHDARSADGRMVQIKATMQDALTFPAYHVPDHYLGIKISPEGAIEEVFNGPGEIAAQAIAHRAIPKTGLHSISLSILRGLDKKVLPLQRITRRPDGSLDPVATIELLSRRLSR